MRLKRLIVRMLVAATLGLVAGVVMECLASWKAFPEFLIWGFLGGIFAGIVIEVLSCDYSITRDDLRKAEKPLLRILVVMAIGLLVGAVFEYIAVRALYPVCLILGGLIGLFIGITIELIRYRHVIGRMLREGEGLDLEDLPVNTAEFIRCVIGKMRYRIICSEVAAELAAHFEDELKDYATDEEKEQKAQQLIAEFGDAKLLAVLLRRAKKRCRPLWRTVVARTFQTVGVLILCFIVYVVWFLTGKPVITTNYIAELNRIVRPTADESLNAAPLYHKAIDLHKELSDDFLIFFAENHEAVVDERFPRKVKLLAKKIDRLFSNKKRLNFQEERKNIQDEVSRVLSPFLAKNRFLGKKYNELTAEQRNMAEKWLREHSDALPLIIEGSRRPYYWRTYKSNVDDPGAIRSVPLPNLSVFRNLAYALCWRAWLSAEQGRFENALDDMKSCYRFGQHMRGDKTLIEQLVGGAIETIAVRTIRDIAGEYEIDSTVLADFQRDFEQIIAGENFTISLKAERLFTYDEIQRCFTSDRIGKGHLYLPRFRKMADLAGSDENGEGFEYFVLDLLVSAPFLFTHPNKEETLESTNKLYDYWEQLCRNTTAQIHAESDAIDNKLEELLSGNIFLGTLTRAVRRIIEISNQLPTDLGAALTMIAVFRYKHDTNEYPQNLNQLVTAGYLKQLPIDSFADKPLVYRKTDDNFILYSVGPNFADDGGEPGRDSKGRIKNWTDNGDTVFWPVPESQVKQ